MASETRFHTCVRGYHVYQNDWIPALGEMLQCSREVGNAHDPYAVKVIKTACGTIVGHLPKKITSTCSLFIRKGGTIDCEVTDSNRKYSRDLPQGGLEIPCVLTLRGIKDLVDKAVKLLAISKTKVIPVKVKVETSSPVEKEDGDVLPETPTAKRIKVEQKEAEVRIEESQVVWATLPNTRIQLHTKDKLMIEGGCKLSDKHINFAHAILRAQFPQCEGLQNTLLQSRMRWSPGSKIVQILHVRSDHWVVISNIFCSKNVLNVYDTIFDDIDIPTMTLLNSMFEGNLTVTIAPLQKQQGGSDCGVFSVAVATSLLHGHTPGPYKQSLLRPHLISCFENNLMLPFP